MWECPGKLCTSESDFANKLLVEFNNGIFCNDGIDGSFKYLHRLNTKYLKHTWCKLILMKKIAKI